MCVLVSAASVLAGTIILLALCNYNNLLLTFYNCKYKLINNLERAGFSRNNNNNRGCKNNQNRIRMWGRNKWNAVIANGHVKFRIL